MPALKGCLISRISVTRSAASISSGATHRRHRSRALVLLLPPCRRRRGRVRLLGWLRHLCGDAGASAAAELAAANEDHELMGKVRAAPGMTKKSIINQGTKIWSEHIEAREAINTQASSLERISDALSLERTKERMSDALSLERTKERMSDALALSLSLVRSREHLSFVRESTTHSFERASLVRSFDILYI